MAARPGTLSGPATKPRLARALLIVGAARFERRARISVSHLDPLRGGTPFPLVATCAKISEADLRLVIRQRVAGFPFTLLGFQAENGSAYSHDPVAELLEPLRIACTPSRPRHSHDTALAESTHGAVGRNPLGSAHRPQPFAEQVTACWATHRTPSVHVQRPCVFPETRTDAPGQARTRTRDADRTTP